MDSLLVADLVVKLYALIFLWSGYPVPEVLPKVQLLPRGEIERLVCQKSCQIRAFYHPEYGVIIDEAMDLKSSAYHQSILLHELVHHAQHVAGAFENLENACEARSASESQAYEIQNRYLARMRASERIPVLGWGRHCIGSSQLGLAPKH
jgi:hypothetical protein